MLTQVEIHVDTEHHHRLTDTHLSQGCSPPPIFLPPLNQTPGLMVFPPGPLTLYARLFLCLRCGLANCRLILLTAVSHRHSQRLLRLLPHLLLLSGLPPPFGIPPPPQVSNRLSHTHTSSLSGDFLYVEFPTQVAPCPVSPPHLTPHPAEFIVSTTTG